MERIGGDLLRRLEEEYNQQRIERGGSFPNGACHWSATILERKFGLEHLEGIFVVSGNFLSVHCFTRDDRGNYIDFTGSQFNEYLRKKIPEGVSVFSSRSQLRKHYRISRKNYLKARTY